jgi:glycosyltransferase involved in cell wall biosynthesis
MRVLVFSSLYPNALQPQFGLFVHRRVEAVARRGVQVRVVAPVPFFPPGLPLERWRAYAQVPARERLGKILVEHPRYLHLPGPGMYSQASSLYWSMRPQLLRIRREFDFDLIDAHYVYPDGVAAVRLERALGVPCVITARGSDINLLPRFGLVRRQIAGALGAADAVVAVSGALGDKVVQLGAPRERLKIVPNGIDRDVFYFGDLAEARRRLGIYNDDRMLLSVGNLHELKGHALVLEALARLRDRGLRASYHIIGTGAEEPQLQAKIAALRLQDCVHLQGAIPNERLRPWYQAASLFVLASSREGWPNVLNEALACGTPVVATKVGGVPEIVRHGDNGLLTERSAEAIADAIETGLTTHWDRAGLARAAARTSWADVAERLVALFARVSATTVPGPSPAHEPAVVAAKPVPAATTRS